MVRALTNTTFSPDAGLPSSLFQERYAIHPGETWDEASNRLSRHVAAAEHDEDKERIQEEFYEEISTNRFMPGGRVWYGAGRTRAQLINCYVVKQPEDSREGWGKVISDVIVISGMGGGVGVNMSSVRPRGSKINGTGGIATGAVSLMQMIDGVGDILVSGGGRRLALMLSLNISHPDMPEFLDKKLDRKELNNANISLILDKRMPSTKWIRAVREGKDFDLVWRNNTVATVNAKDIWEKIVTNAWASGEPGVLNGDLANKENNIWYHKPLVSVNPCGEQWLEENGACDLGALVLPRFIVNGKFDYTLFEKSIKTAVRFLDNVLNVNEYPLNEIRENVLQVRRIGLGIMGLHTMLVMLGYKYSSDSAKEFVDNLMNVLKVRAYEASVDLAKEKGVFPAYADEFLESGFVRRALPQKLQMQIRRYGIRNCALLTVAPTGTTGMVANVSTGIEPLFAPAYWRRFYRPTPDGSRKLDKELVIDPLWTDVEAAGQDVSVLEGAYDITPEGHFEMQRIVQKHLDSATSKTINLPADYPVDNLSELWLENLPFLKGTTFYRAGSRGEEPLEAIPMAEAIKLMQNRGPNGTPEGLITESNSMDCPDGMCDITNKPEILSRS